MGAPDDGLFFSAGSAPAARPRLIQRYEAIALASRCMLTAARRGDWQEVSRLEDRCRELIGQLQHAAAFESLDAVDQRVRIRLLRDILFDDAELRARAEPWLAQIEHLLAPTAARAGKPESD